MKAPSPAFSFYPKDILSDEAAVAMTDEELGIYVRLLCHAWLEGSIPADPARLARMNRRPRRVFDRLWKAIVPCWQPSPDEPGRLIQGRLEVEREKQRAYSAKQSARGKHGGRPVSLLSSMKGESRGKAAGKPDETRKKPAKSLPSPSPSPSPSPITTTDNGVVAPKRDAPSWSREACDDWIERFGGTAPGARIGKALKPLVKKHGWAEVRPAWRSYLAQAEAEFASAERFASTYGEWAGTAAAPKARSPTTRADRLDAKVSSLLREAQGAPGGELPRGGEGDR